MSLTPSKVTWDPNRYKAHEYVITYDSNGNPTLSKKEASYTGVNYNFSSLPSGTSTTSQTQTGTTAQSGTTAQQQTSEAFGNVKPYYWNQDGGDNQIEQNITNFVPKQTNQKDPQVSGFFKPLEDAAQGKKIGSLGQRVKQKFEDISGKTERDWEDVDRDIEIDEITEQLKTADYEEEASLRKRLDGLLDSRRDTTIGSKIGKAPQVLGLGVRTAGKVIGGVFDAVLGVTEADRQRQRNATSFFNNVSSKNYKTRGELGSSTDPGRLSGDPSKDLFAGMNMVSAKGNLEKAGAKRITTRNSKKTQDRLIARYGADSERVKKFNQDTKNMEKELDDMRRHNNNENIKSYSKKKDATPISQLNPNEMKNVAETGDSGGDKGKSIICTQMYQQTQLEDWKKTMQLWYIFQKKYLTIEHQQGYHFLFKPFVNGMKKSKVLTALGKHCAIARTNDIKHIMFGTPFSLSGRLVRLVTEPICYITGKIKSWL